MINEPCAKCGGKIDKLGRRINLSYDGKINEPHAYLCGDCFRKWDNFFDIFMGHGVRGNDEWAAAWKQFMSNAVTIKERVIFT